MTRAPDPDRNPIAELPILDGRDHSDFTQDGSLIRTQPSTVKPDLLPLDAFAIEVTVDISPRMPSPTDLAPGVVIEPDLRTFRVLIDAKRRIPQVFIAEEGPFGGRWSIVGEPCASHVVALAIGAYHDWWMTVRSQRVGAPNWDRVNGIEIVKLGLIERP